MSNGANDWEMGTQPDDFNERSAAPGFVRGPGDEIKVQPKQETPKISALKAALSYDQRHHNALPVERPIEQVLQESDRALKDSGKRQEFSTGSRRDSRQGKGRFDLLFMGMAEALRRMAVLLERGAVKYDERNWEKGQPISRYLDSAVRHLHRAAQGQVDEDHLVQAAWNCLAAVETLHRIKNGQLPAELNDVYQSPDVEPKS